MKENKIEADHRKQRGRSDKQKRTRVSGYAILADNPQLLELYKQFTIKK